MRPLLLALCVFCSTIGLSTTTHAGEAFMALKKQFCSPMINEEAIGICQTYWNLRICYGQSREEAFGQCKSLCNNKYGSGTQKSNVCQSYCQAMWSRDN